MEEKLNIENVKFISKIQLPENLIFKYSKENVVKDSDLVVFWESQDNF